MKSLVKRLLPDLVIDIFRPIYNPIRDTKFKYFGRPSVQGESSKARERRANEGFFDKYCQGNGLDIGYGGDSLAPNCRGWDFENGDAQFLDGLENESFDFVYSSHTLEHVVDPVIALQNWWRVVRQTGYLLVYVPHRDLYEKKTRLPSRWNPDHKHFFILEDDDPPDTLGVRRLIVRALDGFELVYLKECRDGWTIADPEIHSNGEYSIEFVLRKLPY